MNRTQKWLLLTLVAALCLMAGLAHAERDPLMEATLTQPRDGDITEAEAIEIARPVWQEMIGVTDETMQYPTVWTALVTLPGELGEVRQWCAVLHDRSAERQTCMVRVDAQSGEVAGQEALWFFDKLHEWEAIKGLEVLWTQDDRVLFFALYERFFSEEWIMTYPGEGDMPHEAAIERAAELLGEYAGVAPEALDAYHLEANFCRMHEPNAARMYSTNYWSVRYLHMVPDANGYYMEAYGVNFSAVDGEPFFIYAEDGALYQKQAGAPATGGGKE